MRDQPRRDKKSSLNKIILKNLSFFDIYTIDPWSLPLFHGLIGQNNAAVV